MFYCILITAESRAKVRPVKLIGGSGCFLFFGSGFAVSLVCLVKYIYLIILYRCFGMFVAIT